MPIDLAASGDGMRIAGCMSVLALENMSVLCISQHIKSDKVKFGTVIHDDVKILTPSRAWAGFHEVYEHLKRTASTVEHRQGTTSELWTKTS